MPHNDFGNRPQIMPTLHSTAVHICVSTIFQVMSGDFESRLTMKVDRAIETPKTLWGGGKRERLASLVRAKAFSGKDPQYTQDKNTGQRQFLSLGKLQLPDKWHGKNQDCRVRYYVRYGNREEEVVDVDATIGRPCHSEGVPIPEITDRRTLKDCDEKLIAISSSRGV